ncbi:MAG: hypothetical protein O9327_15060 [Polaromonas sp.]|nr:hypothetical protein [Polaromonas sp.]
MPLTELLTRDADPHYAVEEGHYRFFRYGEPVTRGSATVAMAYSAKSPIPSTQDDIDNLVLLKHGTPEVVHNWVQKTRKKLGTQGGEVGRQMASELFMIEGSFDLKLLNDAIQGKRAALLSIIESANTLSADALAIDRDITPDRTEPKFQLQATTTMNEPTRVTVADGKYTVINDNGRLTALRHGEPWGRDIAGDNLIYWLTVELAQAREELQRLRAEKTAQVPLAQTANDKTLSSRNAGLMASLMEEAAKHLAAFMPTKQAEEMGVRHFLPDELDGSAIMLRDHFGLTAPCKDEPMAPQEGIGAQAAQAISKAQGVSLVAQARENARRNRP